jgi:hypothetical protein
VAPLPLARLAEALRVTLPRAPGRATEGTLGRNLPRQNARLLSGLMGSLSRPPVFPDTLLGLTFEWSPDSAKYLVSSRSGAPLNGIRFILYETNPITSQPDIGVEVGTLDILDLAPAAGAQLRFLVRAVSGSPTFLDYTLTFLAGTNAYTVGATGFVSNGAAGARERRFTFNAAITSTETTGGVDETTDFTYSLNVPDVAVELHLESSDDAVRDTAVLAIDYRFTHRNESIRFLGADTTTNAGTFENGKFVVTVNAHLYSTLTITDGTGVVSDANGAVVPFDDTDQRYEDDIFDIMLFGVLYASLTLGTVLAIPGLLLGFSI